MTNKEVRKLYDELINPSEALSKDEFLEKLIKIRDITKYNIYHELLSYTNKNELKELIKGYSNEDTGRQIDIKENLEKESLNRLVGEKITILEIFEKYKDCIKKVFSEKTSFDEKLSSLKITYDYIDGVIFPPEGDTRIQPGSGKGLNKKEGYDRISLLFNDVLNIENNIYLGDFRVVIGKDDNNSLRKYSYIVIEIPKLNKTIFINNKYGEATYIYDGIPTDSELLTKGKESLKDFCTKISFHSTEQWKNQLLDTLFKEKATDEKKSYKNIKARDLKKVLDIEDQKEYIKTELNKDEIKKQRFTLNVQERRAFKLGSTTYTSIARIFDLKEKDYELSKNKLFVELSKRIFGDDDPDVINLTQKYPFHTVESIKTLFKNDEQLKKQRFSLSIVQRREFKLSDGTTYNTIAKVFGISGGLNNIASNTVFLELNKRIFGDDDPDVINLTQKYEVHTVDSIRDLFRNDKQLRNNWFSLNITKRKEFKLNDGSSYTTIARIFDFSEDRKDIHSDKIFIELSKKIFGDDDPDVMNLSQKYVFHTVESIRTLFKNDKQLKKERFALKTKQRVSFKLNNGVTYSNIAQIFGVKESRYDYFRDKTFIELSKKIFGEDDHDVINLTQKYVFHTIESIRTLFKNDEQLKKERFSLNTCTDKEKFKLKDGTTYLNIARIFGFVGYKYELFQDNIFVKLSKKIFGKNKPEINKYIQDNIIYSADDIKGLFANNPQLKKQRFSLNITKRKEFKLSNKTRYHNIVRAFGFTEFIVDLYKDDIYIELSKKIFGDNNPDVINLVKRYSVHTPDSIRSIFSNDEQLKRQRFSLGVSQRISFRLSDGTSYSTIARVFEFKEKINNLYNDEVYSELSKKIFGENDSDVINLINHTEKFIDYIRDCFLSNPQLKKQRFSIKNSLRPQFILPDGTSYIIIARNFGITDNPNTLATNKHFIELSKKIFGDDDPDVINYINNNMEHTVESIKDLFSNNPQLKKQRLSLNTNERRKFKLKDGTTYVKITRIFGFNGEPKYLFKDNVFIELNKRIFGENDPEALKITNKASYIKMLFLNNKKLKDEWFSLNNTTLRRDFRLNDGTSYIIIARILGFTEDQGELIKKYKFIEVSKKIFGENDPDLIAFINKCK